jgi:glycosyltransferase involved in cell wall biosynthesis
VTVRRVLLVTKGLDIGGVERIVVDLALGLRARGVEAEVAVVNGQRRALVGVLHEAGVVVHDLGGSDRIGIGGARRLARLAGDLRYDLVHVHGPLPSVVVRLAARHRPVVTTSHTPWTALHPLTRLAWHLTARRDAATVAVSGVVQASLPSRLAARAVVLPHGVDRRAINAAAAAPLERAAPGDDVQIVTVASHRDAKNYPNLLRAVRHARDRGASVRLLAIGEGPGLDAHRRLAHELGIGDVVEMRPPEPEVLRAIAGSDVLVVASDYEGQPLVVLEALALGRPVVATAVGRVPELVGPTVGRVVPPGDPVALGDAIAELASDPELRVRMGDAARRQGLTWTLDDVVDAHVALYADVVATATAGRGAVA